MNLIASGELRLNRFESLVNLSNVLQKFEPPRERQSNVPPKRIASITLLWILVVCATQATAQNSSSSSSMIENIQVQTPLLEPIPQSQSWMFKLHESNRMQLDLMPNDPWLPDLRSSDVVVTDPSNKLSGEHSGISADERRRLASVQRHPRVESVNVQLQVYYSGICSR